MSPWERALRAVCEPGATLVDPSGVEASALAQVAAGPGLLVEDLGFRCLGGDAGAWCPGWVTAPVHDEDDPTRAEDAGDVRCPMCGAAHRPVREGRAIQRRTRVELPADRVIAWLGTLVATAFPGSRPARVAGVWWLDDDRDAAIVFLDTAGDSRFATIAFAMSTRVVYVVTSARRWAGRFTDRPDTVVRSVAEILAGGLDVLSSAVRVAKVAQGLPPDVVSRPWAALRTSAPSTVVVRRGAHLLERAPDAITVDGTPVLPAAGALADLLGHLVGRWREDVGAGKAPSNHCSFKAEELAVDLRANPTSVQRQLTRLRATMAERYRAATGFDLGDDGVVEVVDRQGYRLRPTTAVAW